MMEDVTKRRAIRKLIDLSAEIDRMIIVDEIDEKHCNALVMRIEEILEVLSANEE